MICGGGKDTVNADAADVVTGDCEVVKRPGGTATPPPPTEPLDPMVQGKQLFQTVGCAGCHTLADAGAKGTVGPNLDTASPSHARVVGRVTNGEGAMPSFSGRLTKDQIQAIATYVSAVAGK